MESKNRAIPQANPGKPNLGEQTGKEKEQTTQTKTNGEQGNDDGGGWQKVTYRRTTKPRQQWNHDKFFSKEANRGYTKAFKNRRCFRCLATGHKRVDCREPIKCYRCLKFGHPSNRCKATIKQPKAPSIPPRNTNRIYQNYAKVVKGEETMQAQEEFLNERPEEMDVFLPTRGTNLQTGTTHLNNSAWIILTAGDLSTNLPMAIKTTLQRQHGWRRVQPCTVLKGEGRSYLIICDNAHLRDRLVTEGPYDIQNLGVRFKLTPWTPISEMSYHPLGYDTWIRLVGLPLQLWEDDEIRRVTESIGMVKYIRPYGVQGQQYEHITLYMSTRHPTKITKSLRVWEGEFAKSVRVQLLGWRAEQQGYFPPPNPDSPPGQATGNQQGGQRRTTTPRRPHFSPSRDSPSSRSDSIGGGSTGDWWNRGTKPIPKPTLHVRKPPHKGIWIPKPPKVLVKPMAAPKKLMVAAMKIHAKEDELEEATPKLGNPATEKFRITWGSNAAEVQFINAGQDILYKITQHPEKGVQTLTGLIGIKEAQTVMCFLFTKEGEFQRSEYNNSTEGVGASDLLAGGIKNALQKVDFQRNEGTAVLETCAKANHRGKKSLQGEINCDKQAALQMGFNSCPEINKAKDMPPGFEEWVESQGSLHEIESHESPDFIEEESLAGLQGGITEPNNTPLATPKKSAATTAKPKSVSEVRRSKRLREKLDGPYVPIIERAQKILGYEETVSNKTRKKGGSAPQLSYMQTMDELSEEQAEVVLATAGIGVEDELETEIEGLGSAAATD